MIEWRAVDPSGTILVSNTGLVRRHDGKEVNQILVRGYPTVWVRSIRKLKKVHRLVAEAFIPNPDNLPVINHIDCNKTNNSSENLEWCTQGENIRHSAALGRLHIFAPARPTCTKLTVAQVTEIRRIGKPNDFTYEELAKAYGIHPSTMWDVINHRTFRDLSVHIRAERGDD